MVYASIGYASGSHLMVGHQQEVSSKIIAFRRWRNTMIVEAQVTINGSKAAIWAAITNIENASETISGIENIEVLEKPANGLVGLRWRERGLSF